MKRHRRAPLTFLRIATALGAATLFVACGIRTEPRPPEDTMARAPTETRAIMKDGHVTVAWTSPGDSVDGKRLTDLSAFVVERRQGASPFIPIAEIPADTMHRLRPVRHYEYMDEDPAEGAEYRVVAYTADGQRGLPGSPAKISTPVKAKAESDVDTPPRPNPRRRP